LLFANRGIGARGVDTLRFGPMKPVVWLIRAAVASLMQSCSLRQENLMADAYSLVGFQNHLRYGEQARVLRLIPGMEHAEFSPVWTKFIATPTLLAARAGGNDANARAAERIFCRADYWRRSYVESVAMGWLAGVNAARLAAGEKLIEAPRLSAVGALARYVSRTETKNFQPVKHHLRFAGTVGDD